MLSDIRKGSKTPKVPLWKLEQIPAPSMSAESRFKKGVVLWSKSTSFLPIKIYGK